MTDVPKRSATGITTVTWTSGFTIATGPRLRLMLNQVADTKDANRQFLSIRLQGTTSNRDAIGARVVVRAPNQPVRLQTLSAGDAYLSQSSKSLHFGMGDAPTVDGVEVRWPNGQWESFDGVAVNGRYLLVEGTGRAQQVATRRHTELSPGPNEAGKDPRWERIVLASPVPLPIPAVRRRCEQSATHSRLGKALSSGRFMGELVPGVYGRAHSAS